MLSLPLSKCRFENKMSFFPFWEHISVSSASKPVCGNCLEFTWPGLGVVPLQKSPHSARLRQEDPEIQLQLSDLMRGFLKKQKGAGNVAQ